MNSQNTEVSLPEWIDAKWLRTFRRELLGWYQVSARNLPWRDTDDPYAIMVSEVMLQQTQASTVIPYYHRFLKRFPTVGELADAQESDVLQLWEGLGYYRRAKSLRLAAVAVVEEHLGEFPTDFQSILDLPGVGRYTAGAIASFAFNVPRPIVEANTQRLYSRLLKLQKPLTQADSVARLWQFADSILDEENPRLINHAVMDLGATICKPLAPSCLICPLRRLCPTFEQGLQAEIPVPKKKTQYVDQIEIAVAIEDDRGNLLMWKRPEGGWWAGLWDLPRQTLVDFSELEFDKLQNWILQQAGVRVEVTQELSTFRHTVTHHRIKVKLFRGKVMSDAIENFESCENFSQELKVSEKRSNLQTHESEKDSRIREFTGVGDENWVWADVRTQKQLPLSSSGRRMIQWLQKASEINQ